jgi:hypothetical protein
MIVIDANLLVIDLSHPGDPNFAINRRFLEHLALNGIERGMTTQGLLEVVGKRSYQTPVALIPHLPSLLLTKYGLKLFPDPAAVPEYAGCTFDEVVTQMTHQMALGDAVMAVQIAKFAPTATALVTWDARHFLGKVVVPVLTPDEWLQQQTPPAGSNPPAAQSPPTGPTP